MSSPSTVLATWLLTVLAQFEARGVPMARLLDGAWLQEAGARNPTRPLQMVAVRRLWHQAMHYVDDPVFGLQVGLHLPLQAMNVLAWLVAHSRNLREGLDQAIRFQSLISNSGRFAIIPDAKGIKVTYRVNSSPVPMHSAQVDSAIGGLLGLLRLCSSTELHPVSAELPGVTQANAAAYAQVLQCEVQAPRECNGLVMSHKLMDTPFAGADPMLFQLALRRAKEMHRAQNHTETLVDHVQASIVAQGLHNASCAVAAEAMDLGVRTLQRRLVDCGTSFRRLLEATRMEEALTLLAIPGLSLATAADQLGYSDASALSHAVRAHWGASPRRLREEMAATSSTASKTKRRSPPL